MSIATEIQRLQGAKSDLATSITNKGVAVPVVTKLDGYAALVDQIQQGSSNIDKDITFIDVDGSTIETYELNEVSNLAQLPAIPVHSGLTPIGWSKTLNQVRSLTVKDYIYPRYTVTDNKIHIIFEIPNGGADVELDNINARCIATLLDSSTLTSMQQQFPDIDMNQAISDGDVGFIGQDFNNRDTLYSFYDRTDPTFTINWGDGTENSFTGIHTIANWANAYVPSMDEYLDYFSGWIANQFAGTELHKHHYTQGLYDCTISANTKMNFKDIGSITALKSVKYVKAIYLPSGTYFDYNYYQSNALNSRSTLWSRLYTKQDGYVVVDDNWGTSGWGWPPFLYSRIFGISFNDSAAGYLNLSGFKNSSLKSIYSSGTIACSGNEAFINTNLRTVPTIDGGIISEYAFYNTNQLSRIVINGSVTSIGDYAFAADTPVTSPKEIYLPASVQNIGERICNNIEATIYLYATVPPTLVDSHGFNLCTIYVPSSAISTYQYDINWSELYSSGVIKPMPNN